MAREKICGIYRIENLVNHKSYVGQAIDIYERWSEHKCALNGGYHNNQHLLRSWRKYGIDSFEFTILEKCNRDVLNEREKYWVEYYDTYYNGYNQTKGGDGCLGKEWSDEERSRVSRSILQIDLNGNVIAHWFGITKAAEMLNLDHRQIWNCASKKYHTKTCGGYIWVYEDEYDTFDLNYYTDTRNKPIRQYTLDWKLVKKWESSEATKYIGYEPTTIALVCKGKFKKAYGYIWTYDDVDIDSYIEWYNDNFDIKYIGQYDINENLIKVWNTPKETEQDGFRACSVREVLNGNQYKHKKYIFKYLSWREYEAIRKENDDYGNEHSERVQACI